MALRHASLIFIISSLLLFQSSVLITEAHEAGHGDNHLRFHINQKPLAHMDPELNVFFHHNDLKLGNQMKIYFPRKDPSTSPHLLSKDESDSIPFASSKLDYLLALFAFPEGSKQAKAIETTLHHCEYPPLKGESKFCASSLEDMLDSVQGILGSSSHLRVLMTKYLTEQITALQNYTIFQHPVEISAPRIVGCHTLPYPYAVFYCHSQVSDNVLYKVMLEGEDGGRVEATAMCHMNTSEWNRDHVAFRVLETSPGAGPVCHFFPTDNLVWIPMS